VPSVGVPGEGVTEWEGWAFTDRDWWVGIAADQRRSEFTSARGAVAVADPDEWDDLGNPEALGAYNALLKSPEIDVASARHDSVRVSFDSSWRPEDFQRGVLLASFDDGPEQVLLDWRSQPGDHFHPDATNERVLIDVPNPPGAGTMSLEFAMLDAGNDWWWAIDNLRVSASCAAEFDGNPELSFFDVAQFLVEYENQSSKADLNADSVFNFFDVQVFLQAFFNGCG